MEEPHINSWEYRNAHAKEELVKWYKLLHDAKKPNDRVDSQLQMLVAVLYLLLTPTEYKKLTQFTEDPRTPTLF